LHILFSPLPEEFLISARLFSFSLSLLDTTIGQAKLFTNVAFVWLRMDRFVALLDWMSTAGLAGASGTHEFYSFLPLPI
jgi:hypothetical protein